MPDQSSNRATLRLDGHKVKAYAAFFLGASVLTGVVVSATSTDITYTTSTGSSANVRRGFRLVIMNSAGGFKHATTVRASGTISSTNMPYRESSKGTVDIIAGDLIEVRSVMQPGDKLVTADSSFSPDNVQYVDQNEDFAPVVCSGGPWAGDLDAGQSYATVSCPGNLSYSLTGADLTHLWTLPTGVTFAPGSAATDAAPTLRVTTGEYLITHQVTDDDSGASWTQYRPIKVGGAYDIILDSPPTSDLQNGASCTLELFEDFTLDDIPDGTLVVVYTRYTVNGALVTFGSDVPGAHHILVSGYTNGDTFAYSDGLDTLTVDIVSPLQWYAETLGLSKVGLRDSSPSNWGEIEGLRVWMMCIQILRWYTWLTETWDVLMHEYLEDEAFPAFFMQELDAIGQVRELVEGLTGRFVCQLNGRFEGQPRPELMPTNHRNNIDTVLIVGDPDILEYRFRRLHRRPVKIVRTRAITSGAKPTFGKWPGTAPGGGTVTEVIEKLIVFSTANTYELAGKFGAYHDRIFVDADGGVHHAPEGELTLPYFAIPDPALCEWWEFDPAMRTNLRGVDLSVFRWILLAVSYELDDSGAPTSVLTIRAETDTAALGVDDTPPAESDTGIGGIDWTPPAFEIGLPTVLPPPVVSPIVFGKDRLALPMSDGTIAVTFNFDYASPTWLIRDLSGTVGSTVIRWRYSANPANRDTAGWLVTLDEIYRADFLFGTPVATLQHTFGVSSQYRSIDASFGAGGPGLLVAVATYYTPTGGVKVTVSRDGGETWGSEVTVSSVVADISSFGANAAPGLVVSSKVPGLMYVSAFSAGGGGGDQEIYVSRDYGATWAAAYGEGSEDLAGNLHSPFVDNPAGEILYYGESDYDSPGFNDYRFPMYSLDGTTYNRVDTNAGPHFNRDFGTSSSPNNRLRMVFATTNRADSVHEVYTSIDGGATRTLIDNSGDYTQVALMDDNRILLWGPNGNVGFSADFGTTIVSKMGNLVTAAEAVGATS